MKFLQFPKPGNMRHQITVQDPPTGTDSRGRPSGPWTDREPQAAFIQPLRGDEIQRAQSIWPTATYRVLIYAGTNVTELNRFLYNGRIFEIGWVDNSNEAGAQSWLLCTEEKL